MFVVVGALLNFGFSSIQTLDKISWIGWVGLVSIMSSIITLAVSVGVGGKPAAAPQDEPFEIITSVTKEATFVDAINAVSVVVLAYAGTPNFLNIVGEMRDQRGELEPFTPRFSKTLYRDSVLTSRLRLHKERHHMSIIRDGSLPHYRMYRLPFHRTIYRLASTRFRGYPYEESLLWTCYARVDRRMCPLHPHARQIQ